MKGPPALGLLSRYRIRVGQTIAGNVWSNTSITITGRFRVVYDDGEQDWIRIDDTPSGSSRAQVVFVAGQVAKKDGWVVGGVLTYRGAVIQRGQCYAMAVITEPTTLADYSDTLLQGYLYNFGGIELGTFVEPGPAGGPGQLRNIGSADPAAGSEVAPQAVPAGAIWLLRTFRVQLVQGITQTPLPTLVIRDTLGSSFAQFPIMPTALGASTTAQLTWAVNVPQVSFTAVAGDEIYQDGIPILYLPAAFDFETLTDGIGANTNYGVAQYAVEEWVMPN